jgi:hypothetical protein
MPFRRWPISCFRMFPSCPKAQHMLKGTLGKQLMKLMIWWARQDLNLGPTDYESAALTS